MAEKKQRLNIVFSPRAEDDLAFILAWTARRFGEVQALTFMQFLREKTERLATYPNLGKPIESEPQFRSYLIRRRSGGHGYVLIYRVEPDCIKVVRYLHSARNGTSIFPIDHEDFEW